MRITRNATSKSDASVVGKFAGTFSDRSMRAAAMLYRETLTRDPAEALEMDKWEIAPLAIEPGQF